MLRSGDATGKTTAGSDLGNKKEVLNGLVNLAEEISRQKVQSAEWLLLPAHDKMQDG